MNWKFWNRRGSAKEPTPPAPAWLDQVRAHTEYTPDILELQSRKAALFFVCDQLMKGHEDHHWLEGCSIPAAKGVTEESFTFVKVERTNELQERVHGHHVLPLRAKFNVVPFLPIMGEVYAVHPGAVPQLDRLRQNGVLYDRKRVKVHVPSREKRVPGDVSIDTLDLWMYIAKPKWASQVDGGYRSTPIKTYGKAKFANDMTGDYSYYSRMEYEQTDKT